MSDGGVVRSDGVIEVHSNVIGTTCDESHDGDKSGRVAGGAMRQA